MGVKYSWSGDNFFYGMSVIICCRPKKIFLQKKVTPDLLCPICRVEAESISHIWRVVRILVMYVDNFLGKSKNVQVVGWFLLVNIWASVQTWKEDVELLVTVSRRIWLRWNVVVFWRRSAKPNTACYKCYGSNEKILYGEIEGKNRGVYHAKHDSPTVTFHIAWVWEWGCVYMYICTILKTTHYKCVYVRINSTRIGDFFGKSNSI